VKKLISRREILKIMALGGSATLIGCNNISLNEPTLSGTSTRITSSNFIAHFGGQDGQIFSITASGELLYYRGFTVNYTYPSSVISVQNWETQGIGERIGTGWQNFKSVFAGDNGVIYAIALNGDLLFYKFSWDSERVPLWSNNGLQMKIGQGWQNYKFVFPGDNGVIYAINQTGILFYYQYLGQNGEVNWTNGGNPIQIGQGWGNFKSVFSGKDGIIYAINAVGDLFFYQVSVNNNVYTWTNGGMPKLIGHGWSGFDYVFCGTREFTTKDVNGNILSTVSAKGIIYAIDSSTKILYYQDISRNGTINWANGGIGIDLKVPQIQGYATSHGAAPGETINFAVSSRVPSFTITYYRFKETTFNSEGAPMTQPIQITSGSAKGAPTKSWSQGCNWQANISLTIPTDLINGDSVWKSGFYYAKLETNTGGITYITFVVKPNPNLQRKKIIVIANVNTWNAYNDWGGKSAYSPNTAGYLSFDRPNPYTSPINSVSLHLAQAEGWILTWLENNTSSINNFEYDLYTDYDLHLEIPGFLDYKVLILSTHPEYWTQIMKNSLQNFRDFTNNGQRVGGKILYLGANGVFEKAEYSSTNPRILIFRNGGNSSIRENFWFRNLIPPQPESVILGIGFNNSSYVYPSYFKVKDPNHLFFKDIGLVGSQLVGSPDFYKLGTSGRRGAASGWEVDIQPTPPLTNSNCIAIGQGEPIPNIGITGYPGDGKQWSEGKISVPGAQMTYTTTASGGFVFSVGSITFGGSLIDDKLPPSNQAQPPLADNVGKLSAMMKRVLNLALL
jgi:N,N-dimethylformamidase